MTGSTMSSPSEGLRCRTARPAATEPKADSTARLPCARLMMRMTENMKRQAAGDQRVVAAEQHALDELVDHGTRRSRRARPAQPEIGLA